MKDYVINELEKLFKESKDSFVTIMANGKFIGNYCTQSYQDIESITIHWSGRFAWLQYGELVKPWLISLSFFKTPLFVNI